MIVWSTPTGNIKIDKSENGEVKIIVNEPTREVMYADGSITHNSTTYIKNPKKLAQAILQNYK